MADLKISQLTGATTPLAGTEVLPIVQNGTTKQVSVANLTAGRAQTSNGVIQGAAGTGYNFTANTPAAGKTSNLLNAYEEGTFTPLMSADGAGSDIWTSSTATGRYTRCGRVVFIEVIYTYTAKQSAGGNYAYMTGIPFTPAINGAFFYVGINNAGGADTATYSARINTSAQIQFVKDQNQSGTVFMVGNDFPTATRTITFQAQYTV